MKVLCVSSEKCSQRQGPSLSFPPAFHLEYRRDGWSFIGYLRSKGRSYFLRWEKQWAGRKLVSDDFLKPPHRPCVDPPSLFHVREELLLQPFFFRFFCAFTLRWENLLYLLTFLENTMRKLNENSRGLCLGTCDWWTPMGTNAHQSLRLYAYESTLTTAH